MKETPHAEEKGKEEVPSALERNKCDFSYGNHLKGLPSGATANINHSLSEVKWV